MTQFQSTKAMRDRLRELSHPDRCDYDRAVVALLDDFDARELAMDTIKAKIERELDELMMGAENYFAAENPKRAGHIRCALDRIMAHLAQ